MARTVIVGDIHGCREELEDLLAKVGFDPGDHLICVGDVIARGPDSAGVVALLARLGAAIVRGNHEEKLLRFRETEASGLGPEPISAMHRRVARTLDAVAWATLGATPLSLDVPSHGLRVVHAGVLPGVKLEHHARRTLLTIRTLAPGGAPSERSTGELWGARYRGPPHVVFGHHAQRATQVHPYATGIDTGCVYGGALTAVVLRAGEHVPPSRSRGDVLVSVPARRVWYGGTRR